MCSKASPCESPAAEVAAILAQAIDELAVAAAAADDTELDARLASAWAMIAAADPELAARAERYSRSSGA